MSPNARSKSLSPVLALGLTLMTLGAGAADTARSVMDYYQQLPEKLFPKEKKYELTRSKGGWITHSKATEDELAVTVDTKNGYIEFSDDGTGGGDEKFQVALFLKEDKTPLMAMSESFNDGTAPSASVVFAEPTGNAWKAVTDRVLPPLRPEDFLEPKCLAALAPNSKDNLAKEGIVYTLPRQGTTVRASVQLTEDMLQKKFQGEASPCPKDSTRELKWDKKAGRFTLEPARPAGKK